MKRLRRVPVVLALVIAFSFAGTARAQVLLDQDDITSLIGTVATTVAVLSQDLLADNPLEEESDITLPLGQDAIDLVRQESPGTWISPVRSLVSTRVRAARDGQPTFGVDPLVIPEPELSIRERIQDAVILGIIDGVLQYFGGDLTGLDLTETETTTSDGT